MRITAVLGKAARLVGLLVFMGGSSAKAAVEEQKDHIEEGNTHPMIMLKTPNITFGELFGPISGRPLLLAEMVSNRE